MGLETGLSWLTSVTNYTAILTYRSPSLPSTVTGTWFLRQASTRVMRQSSCSCGYSCTGGTSRNLCDRVQQHTADWTQQQLSQGSPNGHWQLGCSMHLILNHWNLDLEESTAWLKGDKIRRTLDSVGNCNQWFKAASRSTHALTTISAWLAFH